MTISTISELLPSFLIELEELLTRAGRVDLAGSVGRLAVVDRCRCGEANCAHFHTAPKPTGSYALGHQHLMLSAEGGLVVLDLVDGAIVGVEVLDRPDVKIPLDRYLPRASELEASAAQPAVDAVGRAPSPPAPPPSRPW
jgi:hypothetical protein